MLFDLNQQVVFWPVAGVDGYGTLSLGSPIGFEYARWNEAASNAIDAQGNLVVSSVTVFLDGYDVFEQAGGTIQLQGIMWLGTLANALLLPTPIRGNPGTHEIIAVSQTPTLPANESLWRIQLK